ncbi:hypothetical protein CEXT_710301 [Caerostris extrusa]|uniref:Uncharacterized protein n=1 Tax=Caerostris extrusa TaxID=172846 RepID=A0AAV4S4B5_CAEEX|nr:hypothetical protein CEXT_710301 [Caerostris extrusa]
MKNRKRCLQQETVKKQTKVSSSFSSKFNSGNNAYSTSSVTFIRPDLSSNDCVVKSNEDTVLSEGKKNCMQNIVEDFALGKIRLTARNTRSFESKFEHSIEVNVNYNDLAHRRDKLSITESAHVIMNGPHSTNEQFSFPKAHAKERNSQKNMKSPIQKYFETLLLLQTNKIIDKEFQSEVQNEQQHYDNGSNMKEKKGDYAEYLCGTIHRASFTIE